MSANARAIADVANGLILASVEIAAPPERVWRALTEGDDITRWWGSAETYRTESWTADLRVGGAWRAEGRAVDGSLFSVEGEFLVLDPPRKIVQTWRAGWDSGAETKLSFALEPNAAGTRVVLRHEGFSGREESCRQHGAGWERVMGWLAAYAAAPGASGERFYFCRLVPPRPDFAQTLDAAEGAIMRAHGAYWRSKMRDGKVIVFGPVGDPAGAWGLGVIRVANEAEASEFAANDPAILSARGFRYEQAPMLQAVLNP